LDHLRGISSSFRSPSARAQSSAVAEKVYHRRQSSARFHDARSSV
jgi:1,2-phenylacetyl-CoA epoxidase catalytic subunit